MNLDGSVGRCAHGDRVRIALRFFEGDVDGDHEVAARVPGNEATHRKLVFAVGSGGPYRRRDARACSDGCGDFIHNIAGIAGDFNRTLAVVLTLVAVRGRGAAG